MASQDMLSDCGLWFLESNGVKVCANRHMQVSFHQTNPGQTTKYSLIFDHIGDRPCKKLHPLIHTCELHAPAFDFLDCSSRDLPGCSRSAS